VDEVDENGADEMSRHAVMRLLQFSAQLADETVPKNHVSAFGACVQ
jgi:hypothetical protein